MIKPTVGRVVWFWPSWDEQVHPQVDGQPHAATIAHVHSDTMVNLSVVDASGRQYGATSVQLFDAGTEQTSGYYATWMPFQQGQAVAADIAWPHSRRSLANR